MQNQLNELLAYANGMWRRRWPAICVAMFACLAGWIFVAFIPNTYSSSAKVYIDTDSILKPLLRGLTVEPNAADQVRAMQQTLLTRPNLLKVIRSTDRDLAAAGPSSLDAMVTKLRENTTVTASGVNLFQIAVEDVNPKRAKDTVQALLDIFVEGRLGDTRTDMDTARRFIDEQVEKYGAQLDDAERRLTEFRQKNLQLLAGGGNSGYYERLDKARAELGKAQAELNDTVLERDVLLQQLQAMPETVVGGQTGSGPPSDYTVRLLQLEAQLDQLLSKFTDKHPDVTVVRKQIDDVRARQQAEMARFGERPFDGGGGSGLPNPAHSQLQLVVAQKEGEIVRLKENVVRAQKLVATVESLAMEVPVAEAQLRHLNRSYEVIKKQYDELVQRREMGRLSRDREERGTKIEFRIIEPPEVPVLPSGPNRPLLLSAVLPLGIGAGLAVAFALAVLNSAVSDPRKLAEEFGMPVLGSVSAIEPAGALRARALDVSLFGVALIALVVVYGVLMLIEQQVGLGRVAAATVQAKSLGDVVTILSDTVSRAIGSRL